MINKQNFPWIFYAAQLIRLLPVIFLGISAIGADYDVLWNSMLSTEKPKLVTLTINGEFLMHLPKGALKNFLHIKNHLEEFTEEEIIEVGPLLNITPANAHEPLNLCIRKVLPVIMKAELTGTKTIAPDISEAKILGVTNWLDALDIRICLAFGAGSKEAFDVALGATIMQTKVEELRKLQEILGLDTLEFGRLVFEKCGVVMLISYANQLDENIDEYLEKVLDQKPFTHPEIQKWLYKISTDGIGYSELPPFKSLIGLKSFNFNQLYESGNEMLTPCDTGEILLGHFLSHYSSACDLLLLHMCQNNIKPKDIELRPGISTFGRTLKERIYGLKETDPNRLNWLLLNECIINCLISNEQKN